MTHLKTDFQNGGVSMLVHRLFPRSHTHTAKQTPFTISEHQHETVLNKVEITHPGRLPVLSKTDPRVRDGELGRGSTDVAAL